MERGVSVLKFGGTSVGSGERIRHVAHIIESRLHDFEEVFPIVVVSAMSGVTDQLLHIAHYTWMHQIDESQYEMRTLKQRHLEAAVKAVHHDENRRALLDDLETTFASLEQDVANIAAHCIVSEGEAGRYEAAFYGGSIIAAWGERLSVLLLAAAVRDIGVQAVPVRQEVIITGYPKGDVPDSPGSVVGVEPLSTETRANAQALLVPLIERRVVPVAAGFIGRTKAGIVTTLGRNGSDYSASVIGAALDCIEVTIYTDVDG
ncbi:MAG TPA: aspartate kinase, partial [Ktedonobacteraceae bacterium]|nr:aspartate kinase [Ktedonobacteraceae bacterium]